MRAIVALTVSALTAVVAGCSASSSKVTPPATVATMSTRIEGMSTANLRTVTVNDSRTLTLLHPIAKVWAVMPLAFDSLGIPVNQIDPANYVIGASSVRVRRSLRKVPLSRYIDCGSMAGGPSADTYEINLTLLTTLKATETGSVAFTQLEALGRSESLRGDWIRCSSNGTLERKLADVIQASLR